VGTGRAARLLLTGEVVDAVRAEQIGLVEQVAEDEHFDVAVLELATSLSRSSPVAVRHLKRILEVANDLSLDEVMDLESAAMVSCLLADDVREGVQAFQQRRAAAFPGTAAAGG
jgi:enoyl-CoA hydratase/carnithine racemase